MEANDQEELKCAVCQRTGADSYILHNGTMLCEECSFAAEQRGAPAGRPVRNGESVSVIWQCPFCDGSMKVPDDEHDRGLAVRAHLVEKHRYQLLDVTFEEPVSKPSPRKWRDQPRWRGPASWRCPTW